MSEIVIKSFDGTNTSNKHIVSKNIEQVKINTQAIFDSILSERASKRQGTHKTKTRGEVSGGGKKPWKQKGTGRARAGSSRSPIWVGGGIAFGPQNNRNYSLKVNKKVKKLALKSALALKLKSNSINLVDIKIDKPSTKTFTKMLENLKLVSKKPKKILVITNDENVFLSSRNYKNVLVSTPNSLHIEEIVNADVLLMTEATFKIVEEVLA
ncbi:MAG: 50S ribosomal protein L4 [Mycoplasma sp.]|nr:50S ribosomal protein L4 [Mycoplasma sp.]